MDRQKIPTLVIEHCLCDGCKIKLNKLNDNIPQVHSIKFHTEQGKATISGAVDPATVMEELAKEGIIPKILWEKSSPINNCPQNRGKQIQRGERVHREQVREQVREVVRHKQVHRDQVREQVHRKPVHREQVREQVRSPINSPHQNRGKQVHRGVGVHREPHKPAVSADCYLNHRHELKKVRGSSKRFSCNGCKEDGFTSRYRCERCNFDLHHGCSFPKRTISLEFYGKQLDFKFCSQKPPREKICHACGKEIHGCFYYCEGTDLHPCCARLKAQVRNRNMVLFLCKKVSKDCLWCRKKRPPGTEKGVPGWCYVSECKTYNIHILCITQMLHAAWKKGRMDGTGENSIGNINFHDQRKAVSDGNRRGRGTEVALKIIGILRTVVGIFLGDPSVLFGKLMFEVLEQVLEIN